MQREALYQVLMSGRRGYTCNVYVSGGNAKNAGEARSIAGMMFPELTTVQAQLVDTSDEQAVRTYRDCPALYRSQADLAVPRCLRSAGHTNSHVSLYEGRVTFWDTAADGSIVERGDGQPNSQDEPDELSG